MEPGILEEPDELLLIDLESILPFVSSELSTAGMTVVMETGNNLLMVVEQPADPALARSLGQHVIQAVCQAEGRLEGRSGRDPRIGVGFVVHTGAIIVTVDGALTGGGLLDPASWVPAVAPGGVLVSNQIMDWLGLTGQPVAEAAGFGLVKDIAPSSHSSVALRSATAISGSLSCATASRAARDRLPSFCRTSAST